jgi:hypothetical protein
MKISGAGVASPFSLAGFRTGAREGSIPFAGAPARAHTTAVFVGAWNASGVRVPATREPHDTARGCPGCL